MPHNHCGPLRLQFRKCEREFEDIKLNIRLKEQDLSIHPSEETKKILKELYRLRDAKEPEYEKLKYELEECEAQNDTN